MTQRRTYSFGLTYSTPDGSLRQEFVRRLRWYTKTKPKSLSSLWDFLVFICRTERFFCVFVFYWYVRLSFLDLKWKCWDDLENLNRYRVGTWVGGLFRRWEDLSGSWGRCRMGGTWVVMDGNGWDNGIFMDRRGFNVGIVGWEWDVGRGGDRWGLGSGCVERTVHPLGLHRTKVVVNSLFMTLFQRYILRNYPAGLCVLNPVRNVVLEEHKFDLEKSHATPVQLKVEIYRRKFCKPRNRVVNHYWWYRERGHWQTYEAEEGLDFVSLKLFVL